MARYIKPFRTKSMLTFSSFGIDKDKNFLQSPECPCGCGGGTFNDYNDIGNVVKDADFHCVDLIVETEDGKWKVIEE